MLLSDYERYLACFNARDYAGVLGFWSEDFDASFAGVTLRNGADLMNFYRFFHEHVSEQITVLDFVSNERLVALRVNVRIEGLKDLTAEALAHAGYAGLYPVRAGQVIQIPELILYELESGKFKKVYCGIM